MHKLVPLLVLVAGTFSPLVMGELVQDIAQIGGDDVADTIQLTNGINNEIDLPVFEIVPGIDPITGRPIQIELPPRTGPTFEDTRLGRVFSATPKGANTVQRGAQFLIAFWHQVILDLQLADYSRVSPDGREVMAPATPGPAWSARALAIAHLAMYDAYVGVTKEAPTYLNYFKQSLYTKPVPENIKPIAAAVAAGQACADVLTTMYPNLDDQIKIQEAQQSFLQMVSVRWGKNIPFLNGLEAWPKKVAQAIIADRSRDGSGNPKTMAFLPYEKVYGTGLKAYQHYPDPTAKDPESGTNQFVYAPHWGSVRPFLFSREKLPTLRKDFPEEGPRRNYLADFKEVRDYGRNESAAEPSPYRTPDQTRIGIFWGYDGGFRIGVPPRLYNSIADDVLIDLLATGDRNIATGFQLVKLYAMINVALGDAGVACWRDKYDYNFWRPIIGIRHANEDPVTAPFQDPKWVQLGAPNTNRNRPGINPAFPAFPSGHATFGAAVLETLKIALRPARGKKFEMYSDEFNGKAVDDFYCARFNDCVMDPTNPIEPTKPNKRPNLPRTLTIDQAIEENNLSRIYLGVHWRADVEMGSLLGKRLAHQITANFPKKVK